MKLIKMLFLTLSLSFALFLTACNAPPDLSIYKIELTGNPEIVSPNHFRIPLLIKVGNGNDTPAHSSKVAVIATDSNGTSFYVQFLVEGNADSFYPRTPQMLGNSSVILEGVVILPNYLGVEVSLRAEADSCQGDIGFPAYCRVNETKEDNNISNPITVELYPS